MYKLKNLLFVMAWPVIIVFCGWTRRRSHRINFRNILGFQCRRESASGNAAEAMWKRGIVMAVWQLGGSVAL